MHCRYLSLAAATVVGFATAAAAQETIIVAPSAPPAPRTEVAPAPPTGASMSWQSGHWGWNGSAWVWAAGQYVAAPQSAAVWQPGHWEQRASGGYVWVDGQWHG